MALLKNMDTGEHITRFVSLAVSQEVNRTIQELLSGEVYIQIVGGPLISYGVKVYVNTTGKQQLLTAEHSGALLEVTVLHGTYYGRITKLKIDDRMAGDWFEAEITLCKEVEEK